MSDDNDLNSRWIRASFAIGKVWEDPLGITITSNIQAMGSMEVDLREREDEQPSDMTEILHLSRLWVLDAYELMRVLDALAKAGRWEAQDEIATKVNAIKRRLAVARIPLAKLEPLGKYAVPGDLIPEEVLVPDHGVGWLVDDKATLVTRRDLADAVEEYYRFASAQHPDPSQPDIILATLIGTFLVTRTGDRVKISQLGEQYLAYRRRTDEESTPSGSAVPPPPMGTTTPSS